MRQPVNALSRSVALALVAAATGLVSPSLAFAQKAAEPQSEYWEMVRLYASGEHAAALAQLGGWTGERVRQRSSELSDAVVSIRKCAACPTRLAYSRFPLKAAILLHADRELQEQFAAPVSEQLTPCGIGAHATIVEHLGAILLLIDPEGDAFLKPVYLAMAHQALWSHCPTESQLWARAGLKWFPRDGPLLLAFGVGIESIAFFTLAPAPRTIDAPSAVLRLRDAAATRLRTQWENARRAFEDTLAAAPDLVEARLRLGRVLWRLGKIDEAEASLDAVLANPAEASLQYLAHLFLGRVLEDRKKWPEAEEHYRTALALQPRSETAAVALSHVRFLEGDTESSQQILRQGLEAARGRSDFDPWVPYIVIQTPDGEKILAGLRQAVRP
jgi:tetratricopeptide (TPR) repeat protein